MAESEVTIKVNTDLTPVIEALQVLRVSTRTILAALETAISNLEGSPEPEWRCGRCGHPEYVPGPRASESHYFRACAGCGYVSRDLTIGRFDG